MYFVFQMFYEFYVIRFQTFEFQPFSWKRKILSSLLNCVCM